MRETLLVLALWAAYVTAVHVVGGAKRVVAPFRVATIEPFAKGTLFVVWHMATWALVTLTAAVLFAAFSPRFADVALFVGIQGAGYAAIFVLTSRKELGSAVRLPQWLLLGPLALGLVATRTAHPASLAAGTLVGLLGFGHLAWACGASWPARDGKELARHVLPLAMTQRMPSGFPSRAMTLAVTAVLLAMSACLLAPAWFAGGRALVLVIAAVFALRGLAGLVLWTPRSESKGGATSPFLVYNRVMYSPGCLLIAALATVSVASVP